MPATPEAHSFIVFKVPRPDSTGGTDPGGVEIEEVYATTTSLPANLQLRAGQFLTRFGRFNPTHPHTWDFVDQPLIIGNFFGPDGNRGVGAELSYLMSLPFLQRGAGLGHKRLGRGHRPDRGAAVPDRAQAILSAFG